MHGNLTPYSKGQGLSTEIIWAKIRANLLRVERKPEAEGWGDGAVLGDGGARGLPLHYDAATPMTGAVIGVLAELLAEIARIGEADHFADGPERFLGENKKEYHRVANSQQTS